MRGRRASRDPLHHAASRRGLPPRPGEDVPEFLPETGKGTAGRSPVVEGAPRRARPQLFGAGASKFTRGAFSAPGSVAWYGVIGSAP